MEEALNDDHGELCKMLRTSQKIVISQMKTINDRSFQSPIISTQTWLDVWPVWNGKYTMQTDVSMHRSAFMETEYVE